MKPTVGQLILLCTAWTLCANAAQADVTMNVRTSGKASFLDVSGDGVTRIKGNKMRTEQAMGGNAQALIVDIDGRRFVDLNEKKKTATVTPLASISDQLAKVGVGAMQATLKRTGEVKKVAGYSCTMHDVHLTFPFDPTGSAQPSAGLQVNMVMAGTVCLSTDAPGLADYQRFYRASADSGFIFGDPRVTKSPQGAAQAKAYAELTRKMAEAGMALESHVNITATGDGPMAAMMAKLANSEIRTTVTGIAVGDLPAEQFDVPTGYKVKTQK